MKKVLFAAALSALLLFSCSKDDREGVEPNEPQQGPQPSLSISKTDVVSADTVIVTVDVLNSDKVSYRYYLSGNQPDGAVWNELEVSGDGSYDLTLEPDIQEYGVFSYVFEAFSALEEVCSDTVSAEFEINNEEPPVEIRELKGGISNCYMVDPAKYDVLSFDAVARVNQFWGDAASGGVVGDHPSRSGDGDGYIASGNLDNVIGEDDQWYLELIWSDMQGYECLVMGQTEDEPGIGDERAAVTVQGLTGEGNILIGLKKVDGESYLWSWHLWITAYDPENPENGKVLLPDVFEGAIQEDFINHGREIMDRNLGSSVNAQNDPLSIGLFYQWGRKDPFLGLRQWDNTEPVYAYPEGGTQKIEHLGNLLKSVMNPDVYYYSDSFWDSSADVFVDGHLSGDKGYNRWGGSTSHTEYSFVENEKTIYDPCPEGWRVPAGRYWAGIIATWNADIKGYVYESTYFPASGFRSNTMEGGLLCAGEIGYYWSASPFNTDLAPTMSVSSGFVGAVAYSVHGAARCQGFSVRPIREN